MRSIVTPRSGSLKRSCLCCFSREVALYWTNLQAWWRHFKKSSFVHACSTMFSVSAEAWALPVLVERVGDKLRIKRDVREAVAVLHTTHHPWPGHTHNTYMICETRHALIRIKTPHLLLYTVVNGCMHRGDNSTYLSGIVLCEVGLLKGKKKKSSSAKR